MGTRNELVDIFGDISTEELGEHVENIAEGGGTEPILPEGEYRFTVDAAEFRDTKATGEKYLWVQLNVRGGQYAGVRKTVPFMIYAADGERMQRARNELAALMRACQASPREGAGALLDREFVVQVDAYTRKKGDRAGEQANSFKWKQAQPAGAAPAKAPAAPAATKKRWG